MLTSPQEAAVTLFRGCRAWFNSDDDFDLINAFESVTIENCWAWHAGYRYDTGAACGNGNGIKAGGYGTDTSTFPANPPVHVIRGDLSVGNRAAAFYANHHPGKIIFYNNTGYASNPAFNMLGMNASGADITVGTYRNNLAVGSKLTSNANAPDDATNSWSLSVTANDADFLDVSETDLDGPRQADGSLPSIPSFHLAAGSDLVDTGADVGLAFSGAKPDLGCFEAGLTPAAGGTGNAGGAASTGGVGTTGPTTTSNSTGGATGITNAAGDTAAHGGASANSGGRSSVLGGAATAAGSSTKRGAASSSLSSIADTAGGSGNRGKGQTSHAAAPAGATHGSEPSAKGSEPGGCSCRVPQTRAVERGLISGLALLGLTILNRARRRS